MLAKSSQAFTLKQLTLCLNVKELLAPIIYIIPCTLSIKLKVRLFTSLIAAKLVIAMGCVIRQSGSPVYSFLMTYTIYIPYE